MRDCQLSRTTEEEALIRILKDAIGAHEIDLHAPFSELGGDSTTILIVLMEVELQFGVSLEIEMFFRSGLSSVEVLAEEIRVRRALLADADSK